MTQGDLFDGPRAVRPEPAAEGTGVRWEPDYPAARATDPETTWRAWYELEPDMPERLRELHQVIVARGRWGFTYSELADCTSYRGVSTSTMLARLERLHQVVRAYDGDEPLSRKGVNSTKHQKVMVAAQVATRTERRHHVELMRSKPDTTHQALLEAIEALEDLGHACAEGMRLEDIADRVQDLCGRLRAATKKKGRP